MDDTIKLTLVILELIKRQLEAGDIDGAILTVSDLYVSLSDLQ